MPNPSCRIDPQLLTAWEARIHREPAYANKIDHSKKEGQIISKTGILNIPWPTIVCTGEPAPFDFMLAAVNAPTLNKNKSYPRAQEIANAWISKGCEEYFFKNVGAGIRTFQDSSIWSLMRIQKENWLRNPEYLNAINELNR